MTRGSSDRVVVEDEDAIAEDVRAAQARAPMWSSPRRPGGVEACEHRPGGARTDAGGDGRSRGLRTDQRTEGRGEDAHRSNGRGTGAPVSRRARLPTKPSAPRAQRRVRDLRRSERIEGSTKGNRASVGARGGREARRVEGTARSAADAARVRDNFAPPRAGRVLSGSADDRTGIAITRASGPIRTGPTATQDRRGRERPAFTGPSRVGYASRSRDGDPSMARSGDRAKLGRRS